MIKPLLAASAMFAAASAAPALAQTTPAPAPASRTEVRLDHVALFVADTQVSIDFYKGIFGLNEIPSPFPPGGPRWMLFANGLELHLQPGRKDPITSPRRVHFAVTVPDLAPVVAFLNARHIVFVDNSDRPGQIAHTRGDGVQQIFFQDPDGYWIEVNDVGKAKP
jgi:lactoylglutathione lyase